MSSALKQTDFAVPAAGRDLAPGFVLLLCTALLLALALWADSASAAEEWTPPPIENSGAIRMPEDFSQLTFYLITVDVGDNVWDNFGHSALRVIDESTDSDLVFNWGLFDASGGAVSFASDFFRGNLDYQLGVAPPSWELDRYRLQQRTVWQDRLNLTPAQKATLYRRLAWNLREENLAYSYHYFDDNCTTRIRDYLNEALGGRLLAENGAMVRDHYRDVVVSHYASLPFIAASLDVILNSRVDRRMTRWEEMFLPLRLRDRLLRSESDVTRNGSALPLLEEGEVLLEFPAPAPGMKGYHVFALGFMVPAFLLLFMLKSTPISSLSRQSGMSLRSPGFSYRVLGLLGLAGALLSGGYGLMMLLGWTLSGHEVLYHNLNLLLFWPTDLLGVIPALHWLFSPRPWVVSERTYSLVGFYLFAHVLAALAHLVAVLTPLAGQQAGTLLLYVLPALLCFAILAWSAGFNARKSASFFQ